MKVTPEAKHMNVCLFNMQCSVFFLAVVSQNMRAWSVHAQTCCKTPLPLNSIERYKEEKAIQRDIQRKKTTLLFSKATPSVPCPHVFAISLTSRAAWKSQQTLSPLSPSHTYSTCTPVAALQCIMIVVALVSLTFTSYPLTYLIPFTLFLSCFCLDYISSHTNVLSVCLSVCPSLLTLGMGSNTLNCLQS